MRKITSSTNRPVASVRSFSIIACTVSVLAMSVMVGGCTAGSSRDHWAQMAKPLSPLDQGSETAAVTAARFAENDDAATQ